VTAAAGTLSGNTLASGVTASSLTSVGTLSSLSVSGQGTFNGGLNSLAGFGAEVDDATTNGISTVGDLSHKTTGTASAGIGTGLRFLAENGVGTNTQVARIAGVMTDVTNGGVKGALYFQTNDQTNDGMATRAVIDASGNFGIGTTAPNDKLEVAGAFNLQGSNSGATVPALGSNAGRLKFLNGNVYGLLGDVLTNGNTYLQSGRIDGNASAYNLLLNPLGGNVGIGTTSPSEKLHVAGNGIFGGYVIFKDSVNSNTYGFRGLSGIITADGGGQYPTGWNFQYGGSSNSALYINSSGNVGVNTTSPDAKLDILGDNDQLKLRTSGSFVSIYFFHSGTNTGALYWESTGGAWLEARTATGFLRFGTGGTQVERARITADGNLLVGRSTASAVTPRLDVQAANFAMAINTTNGGSDEAMRFYNAGSVAGTISTTSSTTAYNTSSDYRLKNTVAPMTGALAKVALLKPVTYKWNVDGSDGQGFIAHELAEVVPDCVTGEKDAVDAEGKPQYQGVDASFLVATLTAAIQELTARVAQLESK
jgi:hypothetical protein